MLVPAYPIKFRKPQGKRNPPRAAQNPPPPPPPPPPPVVVMVTAVKTVAGLPNQADFFFSAPVTVIGPDTLDIYLDFPVFGQEFPLDSEQIDIDIVRFTFGDDAVEAGVPWGVTSPPSNLDLHGATMPVPQDGLVVE